MKHPRAEWRHAGKETRCRIRLGMVEIRRPEAAVAEW
jgi:hypothetical protein